MPRNVAIMAVLNLLGGLACLIGGIALAAGLLDNLVPTLDAAGGVFAVVVAQTHVDRSQRRNLMMNHLAVDQIPDLIGVVGQLVVIIDLVLHIAALDA